MRQNHRGRNRHAQFVGQRIIEELVVGRPPERIVHHNCALHGSLLQIGTIELDVLRNAIDDDIIFFWLIHADAADADELGCDSVDIHAIDFVYDRGREAVFHAE